jgi:hypothetical protein
MLLFYKGDEGADADADAGGSSRQGRYAYGRCRVVVPTGNLTPHDWGVGGVMENLLWVADLPVRAPAAASGDEGGALSIPEPTALQRAILDFLAAQGVPDSVARRLRGVDFGGVDDVGFVSSVAGFHFAGRTPPEGLTQDISVQAYGGAGIWDLQRVLQDMGLGVDEGEDVEAEFVTSSLGNLSSEFLSGLYTALKAVTGRHDARQHQSPESNPKKAEQRVKKVIRMPGIPAKEKVSGGAVNSFSSASTPPSSVAADRPARTTDWQSNLRIYFPSEETVAASLGGRNAAGVICFQKKWWENPGFPRNLVHDCISVREGLLMHSKVILARYKHVKLDAKGRKVQGWVYVGSANASESAW